MPDLADRDHRARRAAGAGGCCAAGLAAAGAGRRRRRAARASACPSLLGDSIGMAMSVHAAHEAAAWNLRDRRRVPGRRAGAAPRGRADPAARHVPRRADGAVGARRRWPAPYRAGRLATHAGRAGRAGAAGGARPRRAGAAAAARLRPPRPATSARRRHRAAGASRDKRLAGARCVAARRAARRPGCCSPAPASAHATVVATDPADGSRLQAAPDDGHASRSTRRSASAASATCTSPTRPGERVDTGAAYHPGGDGTKVADTLRRGLGDGTYTASYRVISADSHPVAGALRFVVGNGALGRAHAVDRRRRTA